MARTIVVRLENSLLSLNRVISQLRARRFEVIALTATLPSGSGAAAVTVVLDCDEARAQRVAHCLDKLPDVLSVDEILADLGVPHSAAETDRASTG